MDKKQLVVMGSFGFLAFVLLYNHMVDQQQVQATGGAGQIAEKIMTMLNDAQTYLDESDIKAAQEEIDAAIKELMDTYEADKNK